MTYAIPADVTLLDSNGDGKIDRIYAADTGADARKFLYGPDVIPATTSNNFDALLIGSGDREHPFDTTVQNRYYMIKDDHGLNAVRASPITEGTSGSTTGVAGQLYDTTADLIQVGTAAQIAAAKTAMSTANGWYVTLAAGEKVVSGSTTLAGTVIFGTNTPATTATNTCTGNLGEARLYMLSYLDGTSTFAAPEPPLSDLLAAGYRLRALMVGVRVTGDLHNRQCSFGAVAG